MLSSFDFMLMMTFYIVVTQKKSAAMGEWKQSGAGMEQNVWGAGGDGFEVWGDRCGWQQNPVPVQISTVQQ